MGMNYFIIHSSIKAPNTIMKLILFWQERNKIIPIEVKSSGYKAHKSLDVFTEKYSSRILKRWLVYTKDMNKDQDIFCIPVYMVPFL